MKVNLIQYRSLPNYLHILFSCHKYFIDYDKCTMLKSFSNCEEKRLNVNCECYIVLRDRQAGGYGFCKPAGVIFIPRGEAPRDEMAPKGLQKYSLPIGDHAIVLL